jgi:hypothetical protein
MKFKIGDEVFVNEIIIDNPDCVWLPPMDNFVGKKYTVLDISSNDNYMLKNELHIFYFPKESLSLIKTEYVAVTLCIDDFQTKIPLPVDVYDKIVSSTKIQLKL